jgi:hypothetical protein
MSETSAIKIFRPSFAFDFTGVRLDHLTGDYNVGDVAELVTQSRVSAAAVELYRLARSPASTVYVSSPGHMRIIDAYLRLAGVKSCTAENWADESARQVFADLLAGNLEALVTRHRYGAGSPISLAVVMGHATALRDSFFEFLSRLQPSANVITVIDLCANIRRLGVPDFWNGIELIEIPAPDVIRDPVLDRLGMMSAVELQRWAEGGIGRLQLAAKVKGYPKGRVQHSIVGWLLRQTKSRGSPTDPI